METFGARTMDFGRSWITPPLPNGGNGVLTFGQILESGRLPEMFMPTDYFDGNYFFLQQEIDNPINVIIQDKVLDWIRVQFQTSTTSMRNFERWKQLFLLKCREMEQPFYAGMTLAGFYTLDELLYDNNMSLARNTTKASSDSVSEQGSTQQTNAPTIQTQKGKTHSVTVTSDLPQTNLPLVNQPKSGMDNITDTSSYNQMPATDWKYAQALQEQWGEAPPEVRQTQLSATNAYLNSKGLSLTDSQGNSISSDKLTNKMLAYELPSLLKSLTTNLPFELLKRQLGSFFINTSVGRY